MKKLKKLMAFVITAAMCMAMAVPAMAAAQVQGTLTVSNAMKGQTYKAYKVFNAVYTNTSDISKGVVYTVPSSLERQVTEPFSVGTAIASNGEKIVSLADGTSDADVLAWVKSNYSNFDSTGKLLTYSETDGTANATLDYGYYYITSSLGTVITIDSLNSAVTVVDKNESKTSAPVKTIEAQDSSIIAALDDVEDTTDKAYNYAAVGSVETFQVAFNAVNWVEAEESDAVAGTGTGTKTKVTSWNISDVPTGLNIDTSTVKITVNGIAIYENGVSVDTTYATTVTGGGTSALTISIPWVNAGGASLYATQTTGSELIPVTITYNATVTADAARAVAPNTVNVKYNGAEGTSIGTDTANTYTYKFKLDKVKNEANNYELLPGAKFQMYASDGTTLLKFDQNGTTYTYNALGNVDTIDLTTNATALIQGIDQADYVLKETQTPNGYKKAADTTIAKAALVRVDGTITDNTGIASDTGVVSVVNEQGAELPSTGGMGTTLFYVIGSVLVIGAAVLLVVRRRMNEE